MDSATAGYRAGRALARDHYENFPVQAPWLPRRLRRPMAAVYGFARTADDLADEPGLTDAQRLAGLDALAAGLDAIAAGETPAEPLLAAVADAAARHRLPLQPFRELLSAFRQDVSRRRYADFGELMDYCRRSANPVGRLMLALADADTPRNRGHSDALCSALQLINMLQDAAADLRARNRVYLPADELARFGLTETDLLRPGPARDRLMAFQAQRARGLLRAGAPLGRALPGRLGLWTRAVVLGADRLAAALTRPGGDPDSPPRLRRRDRAVVLAQAVWKGVGRGR